MYHKSVIQRNTIINNSVIQCNTVVDNKEKTIKHVPKSIVLRCFDQTPENNLMYYIRNTYGNTDANKIKELYHRNQY